MSSGSYSGSGGVDQPPTIKREYNGGAGIYDERGGVRFHMRGLREFKVHGGFVASGDSPIAYSNLMFQIEDARDQFKDREIMSGVIRAIKPNSKLRAYLESEPRMEIVEFLRHIKNHYNLTDSATLLANLSKSSQEANQSAIEFIDNLAQLRNDIVTISKEEGMPLPPDMARQRFLHQVTIGLENDAIRVEVRALIKSNPDISDVELGEEVQKMVAREDEHKTRMDERKKGTRGAGVNSLSSTNNDRSSESKEIMEQLSKITAQVNELSVSKSSEITDLKQQMFLLHNRLEELGEASGVRDIDSWQGQDGTTYYNNNNNGYGGGRGGFSSRGGHNNRGGGYVGNRGGNRQGGGNGNWNANNNNNYNNHHYNQ